MTSRAKTSSAPKADGSHPVAYAILSGVTVGLFLPVIGLLLDSHDTYFNVLLPASLAGGAIVAFFVWRRERQTSFFQSHGPFESGYGRVDASNLRPKDVWTPESKHLVPIRPWWRGPVDRAPHWVCHCDWLSAHGVSFSNSGEWPHVPFASRWSRCRHLFVATSPIAKSVSRHHVAGELETALSAW